MVRAMHGVQENAQGTRSRRWAAYAPLVIAGLVLAACGTGSPTASLTTASTAPPAAITATNCPASPPDPLGLATPQEPVRSGSATELVPATPTAVTLCRYSGVGASGTGGAVVGTRIVSGPALADLVALVDSPQLAVVANPGIYNCPEWDGAVILGLFSYASGPDVRLTVDLGGCGFASNGVRTVQGGTITQHLVATIGS